MSKTWKERKPKKYPLLFPLPYQTKHSQLTETNRCLTLALCIELMTIANLKQPTQYVDNTIGGEQVCCLEPDNWCTF